MKKKGISLITVLCAVFAVMLILMSVSLLLPKEGKAEFIPPPFEASAEKGIPQVPEELKLSSPYREGMEYTFSVCASVSVKNGAAVVYFTNHSDNTEWLKLRMLDERGEIIGESGIILPGEYVKHITLTEELYSGDAVVLKIMGYQAETYESVGSVTLNTMISEVINT